jgi:ferredoxin
VVIDGKNLLICNCEKTMALDAAALGKALGEKPPVIHSHLCRAELDFYDQALTENQPLLVACTQEMPLFQEIATEQGKQENVSFINIREQAGWCDKGQNPTAKIAALLKTSSYRSKPARLKSITSDGLCLVYGCDQAALTAARMLSEHLSVTLVLDDATDIVLPTMLDIPIYQGRVSNISGSFGAFTVKMDNYAAMLPSSRATADFAMQRNGVSSNCSIILDMNGRDALLTGHQHRDGYRRIDPKDNAGMLQAIIDLSGMIGEFEKPIYVNYEQDICAHSRSKQTGCNKCLDVCPAGAISENNDYVSVDAGICGGCGSCQAVCPTGAISYAFPTPNDLIGRVQSMIRSYVEAGGEKPVLLIHDDPFGSDLIGAIARYGKGLPGNVLPLSLHAVTTFGHTEMTACLAAGAEKILLLCAPHRQEELIGLQSEIILTDTIMRGLEYGNDSRIELIIEADPGKVEDQIWTTEAKKSGLFEEFAAVGSKREIARNVFGKLQAKSASSSEIIELPANAPYGFVDVNQEACTLCMACVSICPADAVRDTPEKPELRFVESACVQCGLCKAACPENAISLVPRLNLSASALQTITLYEEEPFHCVECGKPFATKSTIERITQQLSGKHAMFEDKGNAKLIEMCADCRIVAHANSENNPFQQNARPRVRTTDDYLEAEKQGLSVDDFLIDD